MEGGDQSGPGWDTVAWYGLFDPGVSPSWSQSTSSGKRSRQQSRLPPCLPSAGPEQSTVKGFLHDTCPPSVTKLT